MRSFRLERRQATETQKPESPSPAVSPKAEGGSDPGTTAPPDDSFWARRRRLREERSGAPDEQPMPPPASDRQAPASAPGELTAPPPPSDAEPREQAEREATERLERARGQGGAPDTASMPARPASQEPVAPEAAAREELARRLAALERRLADGQRRTDEALAHLRELLERIAGDERRG